jgi:hypothetical protein
MVARINREMFGRALLTPDPDVFDSDGVLLALETARSLEMQGELREAARSLGRAADEATKQGNDERALLLAQAAADLTNTIDVISASGVAPSSVPTLNVRGYKSMRVPRQERADETGTESLPSRAVSPAGSPASEMPPLLAALVSSIPPFSTRRSSSRPPCTASLALPGAPPRTSSTTIAPPSPSSGTAANDVASTPAHEPHAAGTVRRGAIRVAINGSIEEAKSFFVERLEKGQSVPAGAVEAMLVITGGIAKPLAAKP